MKYIVPWLKAFIKSLVIILFLFFISASFGFVVFLGYKVLGLLGVAIGISIYLSVVLATCETIRNLP